MNNTPKLDINPETFFAEYYPTESNEQEPDSVQLWQNDDTELGTSKTNKSKSEYLDTGVSPYSTELAHKKSTAYRDHLCIQRRMLEKACELGGFLYFCAYIYLVYFQNKNYTVNTSMKLMAEWLGLKKNKKEIIKKILIEFSASGIIERCNVSSKQYNESFEIKTAYDQTNFNYFYVHMNNIKIMDNKYGKEMLAIYCLLAKSVLYGKKTIDAPSFHQCIISQKRIAITLKMSRSSVAKYLAELKTEGYINIYQGAFNKVTKKNDINTYTLFNHGGDYYKTAQNIKVNKDKITPLFPEISEQPLVKNFEYLLGVSDKDLPLEINGTSAKAIWEYIVDENQLEVHDVEPKYSKYIIDDRFLYTDEALFNVLIRKFSIHMKLPTSFDDCCRYSTLACGRIPMFPVNGYNEQTATWLKKLYENSNWKSYVIVNIGDDDLGNECEAVSFVRNYMLNSIAGDNGVEFLHNSEELPSSYKEIVEDKAKIE